MKQLALATLALALSGCGSHDATAPAASGSVLSSSASAASAGPTAAPVVTKLVLRKRTPRQRHDEEVEKCAKDPAACQALSLRYSTYTHRAGCGVPRDRPQPTLKRHAVDYEVDHLRFRKAIFEACNLGHEPSCKQYDLMQKLGTDSPYPSDVIGALTRLSGLSRFRSELDPKVKDRHEKLLAVCAINPSECLSPNAAFGSRLTTKPKGTLPTETKDLAERICRETLDCNDILVQLDQAEVSVENLAPLRTAMGETLTAACSEGDCTCGNAAMLLGDSDPRYPELAQLGCENGEPDGCFALAHAIEKGLVKDSPLKSESLLALACPPYTGSSPRGKAGEFSAAACDKLAQIAIGPDYPGRDRDTARHYASRACSPGKDLDHRYCIRLGMLWATRPVDQPDANRKEALSAAYGNRAYMSHAKGDCLRPSVAAECEALAKVVPPAAYY